MHHLFDLMLAVLANYLLCPGNAGLAFVGTVLSWFVMTRLGWRTIYLTGLCCMFPVMLLVASIDFAATPSNEANIRWGQSALLLFWFFLYGK